MSPPTLPDSSEPVLPRKSLPHEVLGVVAFFVLCGAMLARMWGDRALTSPGGMVLAALGGYLAADFTSGLVHWLFDTWGSPRTPVVGATFITPFRIHHVDPKDITRHGFIATNGHNCLVSVPVMAGSLLLPREAWSTMALAFLLTLCLGVFATNQFHKWAHEDAVHPIIGWLQRRSLILSREHHELHHVQPYSRHYCITTGWLNRPLEVVGFFRLLERLITAVSGVRPRVDDLTLTDTRTTEP
jgi:plasmanylethanolamine desaturase